MRCTTRIVITDFVPHECHARWSLPGDVGRHLQLLVSNAVTSHENSRSRHMHQSLLKMNPADDPEGTARVYQGRTGNISPLKPAARWSRYCALLQIAGALGVVAHHVGLPFFQLSLDSRGYVLRSGRHEPSGSRAGPINFSYAVSRIERLGPPVLVIWCIAVAFAIAGAGSPGIMWFIAVGPVFPHNLTGPFFRYAFPYDWIFGPLWFVAALMQLQLLLFP